MPPVKPEPDHVMAEFQAFLTTLGPNKVQEPLGIWLMADGSWAGSLDLNTKLVRWSTEATGATFLEVAQKLYAQTVATMTRWNVGSRTRLMTPQPAIETQP